MDINQKILYGFVLFCAIGMIIFYNINATPDYGIRAQDFQLKDIEKIVVTKYPNKKVITLVDSMEIKPIVTQLLQSRETKIKNTRNGPSLYNLRLHYKSKDKKRLNMGFRHGSTDGKWFYLITTDYKNDSIFTILDSLKF